MSNYRMVGRKEWANGGDSLRRPFVYSWGELGYEKDPSQPYHLAVIVIDTNPGPNLNLRVAT